VTKEFTNGIKPNSAPRIQKLVLSVKKYKGSDMDKFNQMLGKYPKEHQVSTRHHSLKIYGYPNLQFSLMRKTR
jgi:hypothetical protein